MLPNFIPIHVFRENSSSLIFDAGLKVANGADIIIHHAVSPSNDN